MINYQKYWDELDNALHVDTSEEFFQSYAAEVLFYIGNRSTMVDTGCGSGEVLLRLKDHFDKIYAIDFSKNMLNQAKKKFTEKDQNISFHVANMLNIDDVVKEPVDVIYNNAVLQYICEDETKKFLEKSKSLLKPGGRIVLMNVPSVEYKDLFQLEFFRTPGYMSFEEMIKRYLALKWGNFKGKLKNSSFQFDDGIGYWFDPTFFHKIADELGLKCQIFNSATMYYRYRFHAVLDLKDYSI